MRHSVAIIMWRAAPLFTIFNKTFFDIVVQHAWCVSRVVVQEAIRVSWARSCGTGSVTKWRVWFTRQHAWLAQAVTGPTFVQAAQNVRMAVENLVTVSGKMGHSAQKSN